MKVLLVHNRYALVGGAEVFYHEVGRVLEKNGHEVAYFSRYDADITTPWRRYFPEAPDKNNGSVWKRALKFPKMVYSFDAKNKIEELIRDFRPDIVHMFSIATGLTPSILPVVKRYNIPVVLSANDYKLICPNYKLYHHNRICEECQTGDYYHAILNRCCKDSLSISVASAVEAYVHKWMDSYRQHVDLFLFASEFMARKTEDFWGKGSFEWDMLQNPFESQQYPLVTQYDDYCLYFGRLIDEKGVDILIRAMQLVPGCRLKIIGNGPEEVNLRQLASSLEVENVEFCGPKWGQELDEVLQRARFVIVPSLWHENFPYVILQSFAWGKAVIGSNRGGIPELVHDGEYGYIYEAHDEKELANKIEKLWKSPDQACAMGKKAKSYMDANFNDETFYDNVTRAYAKVLS